MQNNNEQRNNTTTDSIELNKTDTPSFKLLSKNNQLMAKLQASKIKTDVESETKDIFRLVHRLLEARISTRNTIKTTT